MSLVSASGIVTGIKEYTYRGIQQLPLVLTTTSLLFAITTGSISHLNLTIGLGLIMPIYTFALQKILQLLMPMIISKGNISWMRSMGDTCNIIPSHEAKDVLYYTRSDTVESVPSYWITSIAFFIGYCMSNGIDSLMTPAQPASNTIGVEKRNTQATFTLVATSVFFCIVFGIRIYYMGACEGRGKLGLGISLLCAIGAAVLGYQMYALSRKCGARASDLFGILSQMLPPSSTRVNPIVCSSEDS